MTQAESKPFNPQTCLPECRDYHRNGKPEPWHMYGCPSMPAEAPAMECHDCGIYVCDCDAFDCEHTPEAPYYQPHRIVSESSLKQCRMLGHDVRLVQKGR